MLWDPVVPRCYGPCLRPRRKIRESLVPCLFSTKEKNYLDLKGHDLESTVQHLRKEVQFLNKIRHPDILKVIEVIPESSKALAFVTEPVGKSLANVRKDFRGISPRSNSIDSNKTLVANTKIQELLGICK
mmetsp:Transcript_37230/g.46563  ORF Transcript_37230/g.46563 Transcript_37230/m.46563 type:complete len:130 (+) Transcript_37230:246-635(+)